MCFDLTERRLITGGRDGIVRIWNHHSGACLLKLQPSELCLDDESVIFGDAFDFPFLTEVEHGDGYIISAVECINIGTGR